MPYQSAPWTQLPTETGEAYSAFRFFFYVSSREIDRAWHKFFFLPNAKPAADDPNFHAPPQWHVWFAEHDWDARAAAADAEERQLDFEAAEKAKGNAISWLAERQDEYNDHLTAYRNLRRGMVKLTESGELRDRTTKSVVRSDHGWETVIETVRALEQMKYLERNKNILFPADNSKPTTPDGKSVILDLDTIASTRPWPPPVRDRYQPRYASRYNPETKTEEFYEM